MSPLMLAILIVLLASIVSFLYISKHDRKLPPGPRGFPIVGNLHKLGDLPHQALHHLAKKYGPIMSMRLGLVPTIIISSPQAAELFLKTYDTNFASRPNIQASHYLSYGRKGLVFSEYGSYWRSTRKLCTLQLLSASKIQAFAPMRKEEYGLMVGKLKKAAAAREVVNLSVSVSDLIQNMSCRMVFGVSTNNGDFRLKSVVEETLRLVGAFNIGDFVPFLGAFDLQGVKKRSKACNEAFDKIMEKIIDEHEKEAHWENKQQRDFVDALLSVVNQSMISHDGAESEIDRSNIKAILIDIIVAAVDTSATAIEWTLAELIRHPQAMKTLQDELQNVVGLDKMVEEKDLSKLTYLDMVIKESSRLHPVAPLLVPHESIDEITIDGYHIPKRSRILVNIWAIGRDSNVWSDNVDEFLPERFIGTNVDLHGHDFRLIPFGSGRRGCPGIHLGLTTVRMAIAQLVHCFNWKLPDGDVSPSELDMSEQFGLTVSRASHLFLVPEYRLPV
ncbi:cytochrome P450 CYP736A12 [Ricinus communis]|uniref:Flavonoid 3-hydroxylase, putative n=1 Tax=Ricinus communis TaxID=3988 RepID=B9RE29_RICCO|nr:cytochrome P450 CYP736A12 [Ricinus communis]EEF50637.1 flavonoid 3-hydroxylase, putative [Ricinus communis]|eukprot:XP_002511968.1 cytochrome P450 CYP736A12 [Ricinus communis]